MNPRKLTVILILFFALLFVIAAVGVSKMRTVAGVKIVGRSYLLVDLEKGYPERVPFEFDFFTMTRQVPFYKLIRAVHSAADDENIEGIILKGYDKLGLSRSWELAQAIRDFKKSGKKVYGYFEYGNIGNLLLFGLCDTVATPPQGELYAPGIMANLLFLRGTLDKLGIQFDVLQKGKYKGAGEMFVNDSMSVYLKESYEKLLDDLYRQIKTDWETNWKLPADSLEKIINDYAIVSAKDLIKLGIVDTTEYWNDFKHSLVGRNEKRLVSVGKYLSAMPHKNESDTTIALVIASGNIIYGKSRWGKEAITESYAKTIRKLADDKKISAIVLRVDSPGGSALVSDAIYNEVVRASKKKPVVVSMSSVAASGGYYISMGADTIFATPYTITGSIGVIMLKPHFEKLYEKIGAHPQKIKRGRFADIFAGDHPLTHDERTILMKSMDEIYHQFVSKAAQGRDTTYEWIDSVGQGRVWSALAADSLALVDTIGGLWDAICYAEKLCGLPEGRHARLVVRPKIRTLWDLTREFEGAVLAQLIPENLREQLVRYSTLESLKDRPLYLLPAQILTQ